MPELPEVETFARQLKPALVGKTILSADLRWNRTLATPSPKKFKEQIEGQKIKDVTRRAKYLILHLSSFSLLVHLRMSGDLLVRNSTISPAKHDRLLLKLSGNKTLAYNFENKLATQSASGNPTIEFTYDGNGKRLGQKVNGSLTRRYINDVSSNLEKVLITQNLQNSTDNYYLYGNGLISEGGVSSGNRQYYLEDGIGNIRAITDSNGDSIDVIAYDPYGNQLSGSGSAEFKFKGEQSNSDTGYYYMRARYYDPNTGTFISKDPINGNLESPLSQNGYNYANGNPTTYSDPSGKEVYNFSDQYIIVRKEDESQDIVAPGSYYPGGQDGVIMQDGTIYKNNTGVDIQVSSGGSVKPLTILDSGINQAGNVLKSITNLLPGKNLELSGYYKVNDGSITGNTWNPGSTLNQIQGYNSPFCR